MEASASASPCSGRDMSTTRSAVPPDEVGLAPEPLAASRATAAACLSSSLSRTSSPLDTEVLVAPKQQLCAMLSTRSSRITPPMALATGTSQCTYLAA